MKLQTVLPAALLTLVSAFSINVQAAEPNIAKPVPEVKAEQGAPASKPQNAASAPAAKKHPAQDKSKHYHPRDGKN